MKKIFVLVSLILITIAGCINVTQPPPAPAVTPPAIVAFSASPAEMKAGDSATLLWNVTGATSVTIDQGVDKVAAAGTKTVSPAKTTIYTLTATNSAGTNTQTVTLTVGGLSIIPGLERRKFPPITLTETVFDFIDAAPNASWRSHLGAVTFLKSYPDNANIYYLYNQKLEDGNVYPKVLMTSYNYYHNPQSFIQGTYDEITIPTDARFVAKVGLTSGNAPACSVRFCVSFTETSTSNVTSFDCILATPDNKLDTFNIDLSNIVGKTGKFSLRTTPSTTVYPEYGVWVDTKMIH